MKTYLKILGISIFATAFYVIGSVIMPFSESFKAAASQGANPFSVLFFLAINIWFTVTVFYIGRNSDWSKRRLTFTLLFVYLTIYGFMTQIETIFFGSVFKVLSKSDPWVIILANIVPLIVIIPRALKMAKTTYPKANPKIGIKLTTILWKIGVLGVVYMFVHFLFGYFIAWQFEALRMFYSGSAEKLPFIQHMVSIYRDSNIFLFQLVRGILFSIFILPIVLMFKAKSKELLVSLILVYLSTSIVLITPNFLFPDVVRWAHFIEMMSSMNLLSAGK